MTPEQLDVARRLANAADEGGTIVDIEALIRLWPDNPRRHTTMSLKQAWTYAGLDPDQVRAELYGLDIDDVREVEWR